MSKQVVVIWHGSRGSGKTLSMSVEGARAMMRGLNVWANYPLSFDYLHSDGSVTTHRSNLIGMQDMLEIQRRDEIRDGLILLDEWNFYANSRRSGANANLIFSGVIQLIRKRKLSIHITCQDPDTLDKNIRWQCDVGVKCFDLCFKYSNLPEGAVIKQVVTDLSGVFTGRTFAHNDMEGRIRNSRERLLVKARQFWGVYDTEQEFDVLDAYTTRYKTQKYAVQIGGGGSESDNAVLQEYKRDILEAGADKVPADDLRSALSDMGFKGDLRGPLGQLLKSNGFIWRRSRQGNYYEITDGELTIKR